MGKAISGKAVREMRERERKAHHLEKKIKVASRLTHLNYLIVCEGEKTEPNYFKSLVKGRNSQVLTATIEGEGANTKSLIDIAIKKRALSPIHFDVTWAVFDKDDFVDFNEAIEYAKSNGINSAWSNEAFELWYYLHFQFLDTRVDRHQYIEMLTREIRRVYPQFEYKKTMRVCTNFSPKLETKSRPLRAPRLWKADLRVSTTLHINRVQLFINWLRS